MQIMVFGGAFDPPHLGHQQVAQHVVEEQICDELWFVPCKDHAFNKNMTPAEDRVAMLHRTTIPKTKISLFELEKPGKSYSLETLFHFKKIHPRHTFSWLIGADQLSVFHKWYKYEELLHHFQVFVYPRSGYATEPHYTHMTILSNLPPIDISSTIVREKIATNQSIDHLVPIPVAEYIYQNHLYSHS